MREESSRKHTIYCMNLAVTALIIFGSHLVPSLGVVTAYGTTITGIFLGLVYGYCTVGMVVPSFMAFLSLGFSGFASVPEVLMMSFGSDTVLYIISILMLSAMLQQCRLSDKLVGLLVGNKAVKGKPWAISIMFLLASYCVSLFVNALPAVIICWALLTDLFARAGMKSGDRWPIMMMFGVMYTATLAACVPSFQIAIVSNYGLLKVLSNGAIVFDPLGYMAWAFICSVVLFVAYLLLARFVIRPDMSAIRELDLSSSSEEPFTREQILTGIVFIIFVIGLLVPSILPADNDIVRILATLGSSGWGLVVLLLALLIQSGDHPLYEFAAVFSQGVLWDIVLMLATVFTLVTAITDDATGISQLIVDLIAPMQQSLGVIGLFIIVVLVYALLATFTNTLAVSLIFIPALYVMSLSVEFDVYLFVGMTVFISNVSFLVPASTVQAAMVYAQKEWVPVKWIVIFGVLCMVGVYAVMMVVGMPLASVLFPH